MEFRKVWAGLRDNQELTEDKTDKAYGTRLRLCGVFYMDSPQNCNALNSKP